MLRNLEHLGHLEPQKSHGELALGQREGVAEVEPPVHVRIREGDQELVLGVGRRVRRRVLFKDVLGLPSERNDILKLSKYFSQTKDAQ